MALPHDRLWLLYKLAGLATQSTGRFGCLLKAVVGPSHSKGRVRDDFIFSITPAPRASVQAISLDNPEVESLAGLCQHSSWGAELVLCGCERADVSTPANFGAQRPVDGCLDFLDRIQPPTAGTWEALTPDWVPISARPAGPKYGNLCAASVDVLAAAGACDPTTCLPQHVQDVVCHEDIMFSNAEAGPHCFEDVSAEDRHEYIKLVVRQLRAKQLALATTAKVGGTVIAVGKPGGTRQRAVWHGRRVSSAAMRPPKPRHLASATALALLECAPGQRIRCSKRDASCWYDQLLLPSSLQRWMGRPRSLYTSSAKLVA